MFEFDPEYPDLTLNTRRYQTLQSVSLRSPLEDSEDAGDRALEVLILIALESKPKSNIVDLIIELDRRFDLSCGESNLHKKLKKLEAKRLVKRQRSALNRKRFVFEVAA